MRTTKVRPSTLRKATIICAAAGLIATGGVGTALAKGGGGGTAKPPKGIVSPWVVPTLPTPALSVPAANLHGYDDTGLAHNATVDGAACPTADPSDFGGSVTINGVVITIPCNLIVQMPANTLSWADFVHGTGGSAPLGTEGLELRAVGNMVGAKHIAGLVFVSQQSANTGRGEITGIDYASGALKVDNAAGATVTVQLNDPKIAGLHDSTGADTGRFSNGQSPDTRFSVDQDNPTIHAGTGYPDVHPAHRPQRRRTTRCARR